MKKLLLAIILFFNMNSFTKDTDHNDTDNIDEQISEDEQPLEAAQNIFVAVIIHKVAMDSLCHVYDAAQKNKKVSIQQYLLTITNDFEKCSEHHRLMSTMPTNPELKKFEHQIKQLIAPRVRELMIAKATQDNRQDVVQFINKHLPNNK